MTRLETLQSATQAVLGELARSITVRLGEVTVVVAAADLLVAARKLRDDPSLKFDMLIDLCGIDYLSYREGEYDGLRYAAVSHLLSIEHNWRLRLRVFCPDDEFPLLPSLHEIWPAVGWFEREAFDLYGILFDDHPDLRRLLTDYGFVGHPFRKDFPISGYVEMVYNTEQKRVAYQPVTIEPRENVPRIIREEGYGKGR